MSAGWLLITAGVLQGGGLLGRGFRFRLIPVPAPLHHPCLAQESGVGPAASAVTTL